MITDDDESYESWQSVHTILLNIDIKDMINIFESQILCFFLQKIYNKDV